MTAGLGIYDTMQYIRPPVATWCVGQACSMGAFLLSAGEKGMRHSLPHSRVMIHQPHGTTGVCMYECGGCSIYIYSGTSLIWTPLGQTKVLLIEICPYFRGC